MVKLEGMETADRERLWPKLVQGFKDLSQRLKLQDEVILSDAERLHMTQSNVKMVMRSPLFVSADYCLEADLSSPHSPFPFMNLSHQCLSDLAWPGSSMRLALQKAKLLLYDMLVVLFFDPFNLCLLCHYQEPATDKQMQSHLKGSGAELSRRVQNLLVLSRVQANAIGAGGSLYLPGSTNIQEQSLADMQEVLQQQTGHYKAWQHSEARYQGYGDNNGRGHRSDRRCELDS
ncbi:hypothetical protein REPUB_Repub04eG0198200 [Reevesia pubescens]